MRISGIPAFRKAISRRRFIKRSLFASAGACFGAFGRSFGGNIPLTSSETKGNVVVIGAGVSGLAAARKLQMNGFKATVLEGRDRIGGRVWTDDSLGVPLDLGAAWIHGIEGNPITTLAESAGARTKVTKFDELELYDIDGRELTESELEQIETVYKQIVAKLKALKKLTTDNATSMETAVSRVLPEFNLSDTPLRAADWTIASEIEIELAADLSELSLRFWDEDEKYSGDDVVFPDGYHQIADELAGGLDIKLSHIVSKVEYGPQGVKVTTDQGVVEGDRAVITLPLGVLKEKTVEFSPQLPAEKQGAIERLELGTMTKIALKFPRRFWSADVHRMGYLEETTKRTFEFWNMYAYIGEPVLVALSRGAHARSLEQMSEQDVVAQAMGDLRKIFGGSIPDPSASASTKWNSDPFAHGAYSHVPPGADVSDFEALAEPVEDRLFFAGEATTDTYWGTVHGAILSGEREADNIVAADPIVVDDRRTPDFNGDGAVNFSDFLQFVRNFGKKRGDSDFDAAFDLNDDGSVNFADFLRFVQAFGKPIE